MEEKKQALKLQDDFNLEFDRTLELLMEAYPRVSRVKKDPNLTENVFKMVIYTALSNVLREMANDGVKLTFKEFHRKYVPNLPVLYRYDFTCDEFKQIIEDSYLIERDKNIAYKFFVEKKKSSKIFDEMDDICDAKTIDNNLETINDALLHRACIFNKEKKQ